MAPKVEVHLTATQFEVRISEIAKYICFFGYRDMPSYVYVKFLASQVFEE